MQIKLCEQSWLALFDSHVRGEICVSEIEIHIYVQIYPVDGVHETTNDFQC